MIDLQEDEESDGRTLGETVRCVRARITVQKITPTLCFNAQTQVREMHAKLKLARVHARHES